jgi:uncharacterized protein DUF2721
MTAAEVMSHISSALTPVVMITVTALMANGLSSKHAVLATRMRELTAELRDGPKTEDRRRSIRAQLALFDLRLRLAHGAHLLIYTAALLLMLLVILLTLERAHGGIDAALFVMGLVCASAALALAIAELVFADRTMVSELSSSGPPRASAAAKNEPRKPELSTT